MFSRVFYDIANFDGLCISQLYSGSLVHMFIRAPMGYLLFEAFKGTWVVVIWLWTCLFSPFLVDIWHLISSTFDVMQTKRLRKLVESVLGWTVDEDTEIDEYDGVSIFLLNTLCHSKCYVQWDWAVRHALMSTLIILVAQFNLSVFYTWSLQYAPVVVSEEDATIKDD